MRYHIWRFSSPCYSIRLVRKIRNHLSYFKSNDSDLQSGDANVWTLPMSKQSSNRARISLAFRLDHTCNRLRFPEIAQLETSTKHRIYRIGRALEAMNTQLINSSRTDDSPEDRMRVRDTLCRLTNKLLIEIFKYHCRWSSRSTRHSRRCNSYALNGYQEPPRLVTRALSVQPWMRWE